MNKLLYMEQHGQIQNVEQKMTDMSVIIYDYINLKTGKTKLH